MLHNQQLIDCCTKDALFCCRVVAMASVGSCFMVLLSCFAGVVVYAYYSYHGCGPME